MGEAFPFLRTQNASSFLLGYLKADLELGRIPVRILGQCWNKLLSAAAEAEILVVSRGPVAFAVVWGLLVDLVSYGFIKIKLRNKFLGAPGRSIISNLKVDVHRPTGVPTWVDREEFGNSVCVCYLITTEKLFAAGIESCIHVAHIRINAERVALPNIDDSAAKRATRTTADAGNMERQT
jgi:hypothetical protein